MRHPHARTLVVAPATVALCLAAMVRAVPGRRRNVAVTPLADRAIGVDSSRGLDFALDLLRTSARFVHYEGE